MRWPIIPVAPRSTMLFMATFLSASFLRRASFEHSAWIDPVVNGARIPESPTARPFFYLSKQETSKEGNYDSAASASATVPYTSNSGPIPVKCITFCTRCPKPTNANFRPFLWHATNARTSDPTAIESTNGTSVISNINRGDATAAIASTNAPRTDPTANKTQNGKSVISNNNRGDATAAIASTNAAADAEVIGPFNVNIVWSPFDRGSCTTRTASSVTHCIINESRTNNQRFATHSFALLNFAQLSGVSRF